MERAKPDGLPADWEPLVIGPAAKVVADFSQKHRGESSVRVDAPDSTRAYAMSEKIPVSPGDEMLGSAWVRVHDVEVKSGVAIVFAEFFDANGNQTTVEKFDTANLKKPDVWQHVSGKVKVPDGAMTMRVRVGFSYAKGTCWWDDVEVTAHAPVSARVDLPEPRLSPAVEAIPITLMNRVGTHESVKLDVSVGKQSGEKEVALSGERTQRVEVPVTVPAPGKTVMQVNVSKVKAATQPFEHKVDIQVPKPIVMNPLLPTHWCVEDGATKIEGTVDLATANAKRAGAKLRVELRDSNGKSLKAWDFGGESIPDGITKFSLDPGKLTLGEYSVVATLTPKSGKELSAEQPWHVIPRRLAKVTISANGYPVYDGKEILPLGIFNGGKWEEQAKAGFTVTHAYNAARITPGPRPDDADALKWLDETNRNGMKMMLQLPMKQIFAGDWDVVRRRIRMFRNHPGLLAWDEEEGNARGDFKPDTLKKLYAIVHEEDPNHPFMVGDSYTVITKTDRSKLFPVDEMDMGMWWWYPFPFKSRDTGDALNGEDKSNATELTVPEFFTKATTTKPIWLGVQSYAKDKPQPKDKPATKKKDSEQKKEFKDKFLPYPTPAEYRCQAYLGLVAGAKGLMWYGGAVTGGISLYEKEGHWEDLKKVVHEIYEQREVFLSPSLEKPNVLPANAPISVMLKKSGDGYVLFAVNRSVNAVDATISSPNLHGAVSVRGENRSVNASDGKIVDHFEPLAVHIYEF